MPELKWQRKKLGKASCSSVAVDDAGNPHVIFDRGMKAGRILTHAWSEGSHWFSEPIEEGLHVGYDNSVAIDASGDLHVAYMDYVGDTWTLKHAHRTGGVWQTETVDSGGYSNSIAIDEKGFVHIVHMNAFTARYAKQTASGWETETVSGGLWYGGSSLILRDGNAYATFSDNSLYRKLFLATRDAGVWTLDEIDSGGTNGSMAFDQDGIPHVAYFDEEDYELRHAWLTGTGWQSESLVTQSTIFGDSVPAGFAVAGEWPALAEDSKGRLQLAFTLHVWKGNGLGTALVGASFDGDVWTPNLTIPKPLGGHTSIAVAPNDLVHISIGGALGPNAGAISAVRSVGARLTLSVVPKGAGVVSALPSGLQSSGKASEFFYPGTELTLTATPAEGFTFVRWSPATLGTDPVCTVTMDHDRKVAAHFKSIPN